MKDAILDSVGKMFTLHWVNTQGNKKLNGFDRSAERCLREKKDYNNFIFLSLFICAGGTVLTTIESLLVGIMIIVIGVILNRVIEKWLAPGNTALAIIKNWKPIRKKLLEYGVVRQTEKNFKEKYPESSYILQDEIRDFLVRTFDDLMSSLSGKLTEAQREGFPKKEASLLGKMLKLKELARDIGLEMNFDQYLPK